MMEVRGKKIKSTVNRLNTLIQDSFLGGVEKRNGGTPKKRGDNASTTT